MKRRKSVQNRILDRQDNVVLVDFKGQNMRLNKVQLNKIERAIDAINLKQAHGVELTDYEENELQRYIERLQGSLDTFKGEEGQVIYVDFVNRKKAA